MSTVQDPSPSAASADEESVSLRRPSPKKTPEQREARFRGIVVALGVLQLVAIVVAAILLIHTTRAATQLPPCIVVGQKVGFRGMENDAKIETVTVKGVDGLWVEIVNDSGGSTWVNWANMDLCFRP